MSSDDSIRNDDPTTKLPDEAEYHTKPGITAVLERINKLSERLSAEIQSLRAEMNQRFSQVDEQLSTINAKIDMLNDDLRRESMASALTS